MREGFHRRQALSCGRARCRSISRRAGGCLVGSSCWRRRRRCLRSLAAMSSAAFPCPTQPGRTAAMLSVSPVTRWRVMKDILFSCAGRAPSRRSAMPDSWVLSSSGKLLPLYCCMAWSMPFSASPHAVRARVKASAWRHLPPELVADRTSADPSLGLAPTPRGCGEFCPGCGAMMERMRCGCPRWRSFARELARAVDVVIYDQQVSRGLYQQAAGHASPERSM